MIRRQRTSKLAIAAVVTLTSGAIAVVVHSGHPHPAAPARRHRAAVAPAVPPGLRLEHFTIRSSAVHQTLDELLLTPRSPDRHRGLVVFLHADRGSERSTLSRDLFAALERLGRRAPAMVFLGGARRSYWHDRAGARWARYVLDEVLPAALRRTRGDPRRVMIAGISMGAYGALDLARLHPGRFCAVAMHSPRLWRHWHAAALAQPRGFDDRRDFTRHNLLRAAARTPRAFAGRPLWLDAGRDDGLARPGSVKLARILRRHGIPLRLHVGWPGGHNGAYWGAHWSAYLGFDVAALRHCRR